MLPSSTSLFQILQALDRQLQGLEVGQHAAEPALVDIRHTGALRFFRNDFAGLALGAHHQDGALVGGHATDESHRLGVTGNVFSRLMMWILLRWPKMYGAILGFQKRVWCPKWTPASSISRMDTDIEVSDQGLTSARPCSPPALPAAHPIGRAADMKQRHRACGFV
jgi:hypothetical protein